MTITNLSPLLKFYFVSRKHALIDAILGKKHKKINEAIYGCIVVCKHKSKWKDHTGFPYGKTKGAKYILLGGNQIDTILFDSYGEGTSSTKAKKLYDLYIQKGYIVTDQYNLKSTDIYDNADTLNIMYGVIT